MNKKVFISYSRRDKQYKDELLEHLNAISRLKEKIWLDVKDIDIGDPITEKVKRAMGESRIAILLLSNHYLNSNFITQYERPFLLQQAEQKRLKLCSFFLTAISRGALEFLPDYLAAHDFKMPLDTLEFPQRNQIYAKIADWVDEQLSSSSPSLPQPSLTEGRNELAVRLRRRSDHWQHEYFLPYQADAIKPQLDCPEPTKWSSALVDGEDLFQLLFGGDPQKRGQLLAAAFGKEGLADPTCCPLRLYLQTDDPKLQALPWGRSAYQNRSLYQDGWTVELRAADENGFPEYPPHTCYFPGRVLLVASEATRESRHFHDLQGFFQRRWQDNPHPVKVSDAAELRTALQAGSTRFVYYYGPASQDGLLLNDAGECTMSWQELAERLAQSRSVSLLFLNLIGELSSEAIAQGSVLLSSVRAAVLFQCNAYQEANRAAKAALTWLDEVFCNNVDPVAALHQHQWGHIAAWTHYSHWQITAPKYASDPDLVNLLLDRHKQRDRILGAKEEFYTDPLRRIFHGVALGKPGSRTAEFPAVAKHHLVHNKREQEVYRLLEIKLATHLDSTPSIDDAIRRTLQISPHQSIIHRLMDQDAPSAGEFRFVILGWQLPEVVSDSTDVEGLVRAVAEWCRGPLLRDLDAPGRQTTIRIISLLALETATPARVDELAEKVMEIIEGYDENYASERAFHFGELDPLTAVRRKDLNNYFQNPGWCRCDDRYRSAFPDLLLSGRKEMLFDEAVTAIRRGEPDNWGNLYDELTKLKEEGAWPPQENDGNVWERYNG